VKEIGELYNLNKFWEVYSRQNRGVSQWDDKRTDMEVFINRTIAKWFVGKFYQIEIERHKLYSPPFDKPATTYKVFTKFVYITNIKFAFAPYHNLITINYIEPHSEKIEKVDYGINDFSRLKLMENESDFRILKKFYPVRVEEIVLPDFNQFLINKKTNIYAKRTTTNSQPKQHNGNTRRNDIRNEVSRNNF